MSHDYSPTSPTQDPKRSSISNASAFPSSMVTDHMQSYVASSAPRQPAPPIPQQQYADVHQYGTVRSTHSLASSYISGDYTTPALTSTFESNLNSRQNTITSQHRSEIIGNYQRTVYSNSQTDEVTYYVNPPGSEAQSPMEYIDQASEEHETYKVVDGNSPSVNRSLLLQRKPVADPNWNQNGQPMTEMSPPIASAWSNASTMPRDPQRLEANNLVHHIDQDNEAFPDPPQLNQSQKFQPGISKAVDVPVNFDRVENKYYQRKMDVHDNRSTQSDEGCTGCLKKVGCFINHKLMIAFLISFLETILIITFFSTLRTTWWPWYFALLLEFLIIVSFATTVFGFIKEKDEFNWIYVVIHAITSVFLFALGFFYLFANDSGIFQAFPPAAGSDSHKYHGKLVDFDFSRDYFANLQFNDWFIGAVLMLCALADCVICIYLGVDAYNKHVEPIDRRHNKFKGIHSVPRGKNQDIVQVIHGPVSGHDVAIDTRV